MCRLTVPAKKEQRMIDYPAEAALTAYLQQRLTARLAGRGEAVCLDKVPGDRYHLGVLMPSPPRPPEQKMADTPARLELPAQKQALAAVGIDFVIQEAETVTLVLTIRFACYTRRFPTFAEQCAFSGALSDNAATGLPVREKYHRHDMLIADYPLTLPGNRPAHRRLTEPIAAALDRVLSAARQEPDIWRQFSDRQVLPQQALQSAETYRRFLQSKVGAAVVPPFAAALDVRAEPAGEGRLRLSLFFTNTTPPGETNLENALRSLIDVSLEVRLVEGKLLPGQLIPDPQAYQLDHTRWATGHGANIVVDPARQVLQTEALAHYAQPRPATRLDPPARFTDLAADPLPVLQTILTAMETYAAGWEAGLIDGTLVKTLSLDEESLGFCRRDLHRFRLEAAEFTAGVRALQADPRLMQAFQGMNRVFQRLGQRQGFDRWFLFQIGFIVSQLPALAVREKVIESDTLNRVDVLWFSTGGGKTEAYLGLIVCAALYDRLRGKARGVTAWLRFPLRMLSVQQLHRAMRVIWEAEQERRTMFGEQAAGADPFSLGYLVGQGSTPNALNNRPDNPWRLREMAANPALREQVQIIARCPRCDEGETVTVEIDEARVRIRHRCKQCGLELPLYVSDDEIYRFAPTVLIGTVDKLATLAYQSRFSALWGGIDWRCGEAEHGYSMGDYCAIYGCQGEKKARKPVTVYDPAPALTIQDELHLLQEELGAFTGHYETLLRYCQTGAGGLPSKILAATATIAGVDHQARHLYGLPARQFPGRGYDRFNTFYTTLARDSAGEPQINRHYLAFFSHYMTPTESALLCLEILHDEIRQLYARPGTIAARLGLPDTYTPAAMSALLHRYDTSLTYVGSKAAGTRIEKTLDQEVGQRIPRAGQRQLTTAFLNGQSTMADIHSTVIHLEKPPDWQHPDRLDALVATSMISHGVDVARLNVMVINGMPARMADYIQTSSRVGRRHVGLVVVVFSPTSIRDQSIYRNFVAQHRQMDRLVNPVPINRFARFIVQRTLPGVMAGLVMGLYIPRYRTDRLKQPAFFRRLLDGMAPFGREKRLTPAAFLADVCRAYGLEQDRYDAGLELAMKEAIETGFRQQLRQLRTGDEPFIFTALSPKPMRSLRDVDRAIPFEPDPARTGWAGLRWVDRGKEAQ